MVLLPKIKRKVMAYTTLPTVQRKNQLSSLDIFTSAFLLPKCTKRQSYIHEYCQPVALDQPGSFSLFVVPLSIRLGRIVSILDYQIFWSVVVATREIRFEDVLCAPRITCLSINRCTRHVRHHCITAIHGVFSIAERMVLGCWLREPDVTSVTTEMARLESFGNVLFDNDGAAGGVDEP